MLTEEYAVTSTVLTSLGLDATTLANFKYHAGLDTDPSWTEADGLLQKYLLTAEKYINAEASAPYREMAYTQRFRCLAFSPREQRYYLSLQMWPIKATSTSIVSKDDTGTQVTYVEGTDYEISNGPKPCLVFKYGWTPPTTSQVLYPWTVTYTAGGLQNEIQLTAIFQLAAYYQRFPEAMGKPVPDNIFQSHIDAISAGGYL